MDVAALAGWVARGTVGVALLASGVWKLAHPGAFRAAARAALPDRAARLAPVLVVLLPPVELAAAALLLTTGALGRVAALGAAGLLVVFTVVLVRAPDAQAGCGCWHPAAAPRSAADVRGRHLVRNGILLAAAAAGAALPPAATPGVLLLLPAAALLAVLVLEVPTIGAVLAAGRR